MVDSRDLKEEAVVGDGTRGGLPAALFGELAPETSEGQRADQGIPPALETRRLLAFP